MGESYPRRDQARGLWKINDITKNIKEDGTYPIDSQSQNALFIGGATPSVVNNVDQISMATSGNATDFGDMVTATKHAACVSSVTRCITIGGSAPGVTDTMEYVHFKNQGNFADFGNLSASTSFCGASSNQTRGFRQGGATPSYSNIIEFVEMATLGNMTDFGDLTQTVQEPGGAANSTRALTFGGYKAAPSYWQNRIEFFEISSSGGSTDFGDLTKNKGSMGNNNSSKTIAFASGGYEGSGVDDYTTNVDRITINSLGNAVAFATLATASGYNANASNTVRSIVAGGGAASPGRTNRIEFNSFQSGGSGTDFGDLTAARSGVTGGSNGHGGIETFVPRAPELYSPTGEIDDGNIGYMGAGNQPSVSASTSFYVISSTGNASNFGDLTQARSSADASGNRTRAVFAGGYNPGYFGTMDYIDPQSKGNAADFGDLSLARYGVGAVSEGTKIAFLGGDTPTDDNRCDSITIATLGNATDFGDTTASVMFQSGGHVNSSTRGIIMGGYTAPTFVNTIQYVTFSSLGDCTDFGDLTEARYDCAASSSSTRGVCGGGHGSPDTKKNVIDYITIASTGNATDFGDLSQTRSPGPNGISNKTRATFNGGITPSLVNTIDFVTIAATGNATDFGDCVSANSYMTGNSTGHGGLS